MNPIPKPTHSFPNLMAYPIPAPIYPKNRSKKMFPHGFIGKYNIVGDTIKLISIVYYLGRRGYKFEYDEYNIGGVDGHSLTIHFRSKRQYTYFKKRFG